MTPARTAVAGPNSREKILEIAEPLFAFGGYAGVGMRQLAGTVGLSKSSLFHHFPAKLDLYAEVLDRVLERLEGALGDDGTLGAGPAERLDQWVTSILGTLADDAPSARLVMRALAGDEPFLAFGLESSGRALMPFENRLARIIGRFRVLLEEGVRTGVFRTVEAGDAIQSVIGAVVFHSVSGDVVDALVDEPTFTGEAMERRRREVSEFIRRGLMA